MQISISNNNDKRIFSKKLENYPIQENVKLLHIQLLLHALNENSKLLQIIEAS